MLKVFYLSGNDSVAVSQKNIESMVDMAIQKYHSSPTQYNTLNISQVDAINVIGTAIFKKKIRHNHVCIVIEELQQTILFDEEGALLDFWYSIVPSIDY